MNIKPLHDWAVIKISEPEEKTTTGIIIPEIAKEKPLEGIVAAIGPGRYRTEKGRTKFIPTTLKPGQRVTFLQYMARELELDGEVITLVREDDILGTYEETPMTEKKPFEVEARHENPVVLKEETIPAVTPAKKKAKASSKKSMKKNKTTKKKVQAKTADTKKEIASVSKKAAQRKYSTKAGEKKK
jgi:chaperonin GroES